MHSHSHSHQSTTKTTPTSADTILSSSQSRLDTVLAFLQDQFGPGSISLIDTPKPKRMPPAAATDDKPADSGDTPDTDMDTGGGTEAEVELARLRATGVPVPGIRIAIDKIEATVWLEQLEVECGNKAFGDRVRAVLERALDMVDGAWV
jgi:cleavage and polyadenylation specificity factor subunit 3